MTSIDRYSIAKQLIEQCQGENDEQMLRALKAINVLYGSEEIARANSSTTDVQPIVKRKYKRRAADSKLGDWPRQALAKYGRATPKQTWDFMIEKGIDYLLPPGFEENAIERFYNKNINRSYRKYPDGSWGFCQPVIKK